MGSQRDWDAYERTIVELREAEPTWASRESDRNCDKKGIGFNAGRPSETAFSVEVRFQSWEGYYGRSSVARLISFSHEDLVREAFIRCLNRRWASMFSEMANDLEQESQDAKSQRIKELRDELARLDGAEPCSSL